MSTTGLYSKNNPKLAQMLFELLPYLQEGTNLGGLVYVSKRPERGKEKRKETKPEEKPDYMKVLTDLGRPELKYKFNVSLAPTKDSERVAKDMLEIELDDKNVTLSSRKFDDSKGNLVCVGKEYSRQDEAEPFLKIFASYKPRGFLSRGPVSVSCEIEVNTEKAIAVMLAKLEKHNFNVANVDDEINRLYEEMHKKDKPSDVSTTP